jgi:hypothetical protein
VVNRAILDAIYKVCIWAHESTRHPTAQLLTAIMGIKIFVVAALAAVTLAKPIPDPLNVMRQSGPAAGQVRLVLRHNHHEYMVILVRSRVRRLEANHLQVITKCNAPGQLALAYDDGPYQYTQKLVDTLTAGGAKGTFFVTGENCVYNLHKNFKLT